MATITNTNVEDNRFWIQIMGDFARFIFNALSPAEVPEADIAKRFITQFDNMLNQSRQDLPDEQLKQLNLDASRVTQDFRKYILHLIRRQISEKIVFSLRPSFLNHMVNDTELYLNLLHQYKQNNVAVLNPAAVSIIWLTNVYVNALTAQGGLDTTVFNTNKKRAGELANEFLDLYFKAFVMNGLRRSGLDDFPALTSLNDDIAHKMIEYAEFLVDLINLMEQKKVLGNITLLYLDSMYRQLCYYITELSRVSTVKAPICDPASPRRE